MLVRLFAMLGKREVAYVQKTLRAKLYTMWGGLVAAKTTLEITLAHTDTLPFAKFSPKERCCGNALTATEV